MIAAIIRTIGLPACLVALLLVYYEGLPGAARIPFLSSVPVIGDLATGRVHAHAADEVRRATADLVARAKLRAVEAQLERERVFRRAADNAAREAVVRAHAAERAKDEALADLEDLIAADTGDDGAVWTEGDLQWLER
ncbi:hypothetical protein [uncultured Hoeflea sp.]|uniref:hypothetical protein n=1 Tax=uncultured Hoeflea sp. TaxID=538666 RepID=UPI00263034BD|nr:hypothetical protein [uncultured Hoeflea sp.]